MQHAYPVVIKDHSFSEKNVVFNTEGSLKVEGYLY